MITLDDPRYALFASARDNYWKAVGTLDEDMMAYAISPQFTGSPAWPTTRQAFRIVRTPQSLIITSDGLTDLFVDTDMQVPGFETEVYIEFDKPDNDSFDSIRRSWAFSLVESFARNIANWRGIRPRLERLGTLSIELPAPDNMPKSYVTSNGTVGALINIPAANRISRVQLSDDANILMVPLTIISPSELGYLIKGSGEARQRLTAWLNSQGIGHVSRIKRKEFAR